jgi:hypothetical protein
MPLPNAVVSAELFRYPDQFFTLRVWAEGLTEFIELKILWRK